MKIITLNTWGGRAGKETLLSFFEKYKAETDIFCLQEIWADPHEHLEGHSAGGRTLDYQEVMVYGLQELSALLSEYTPYFRPHFGDHYGLLMFVKKDIKVLDEGERFVYKHKGHVPKGDLGNHARNIQYVTVEGESGPVTVINFHGLWNGKGKTDSDDRIAQSEKILSFMKGLSTDTILCGDFNLLPNTKSLKMFEESGYKNLISEYGITSTRTSHYTKPERFADYVFISQSITPKHFEVLPEEVSDHAALLLEI